MVALLRRLDECERSGIQFHIVLVLSETVLLLVIESRQP
jgi:hypothetical protein